MKQAIFQEIRQHLREGRSADQVLTAEGRAYVRRWIPGERLILLGGGHIAQPLCRIGAMLDFAVTVVDDRPSFANQLRFPEAEEVLCMDFGGAIDRLRPGQEDFVCVITRGHRWDAECLRRLLSGKETKYLGMIGSKRRVAGLLELLRQEGYEKERLEQICAPIGLAIHAQTTAEIAVSIAAQLVQYRRAEAGKGGEQAYLPQTNVDRRLLDVLAETREPLVAAVVVETKGSTPVKAGAMMAVGTLGRVEGTIGGGCGEAEVIREARRMAAGDNDGDHYGDDDTGDADTGNNSVGGGYADGSDTGTHGAGGGEKRLIQVSMTNEAAEEEGMACGGIMEVLLERVVPDEENGTARVYDRESAAKSL